MTMSLTGEPDEPKGSRPVRWGAVGKVPDVIAMSGNSLAAYPVALPSRPPLVVATNGVGVEVAWCVQGCSSLSVYLEASFFADLTIRIFTQETTTLVISQHVASA